MRKNLLILLLCSKVFSLSAQVICKHFDTNLKLLSIERPPLYKKEKQDIDIIHQRIEIIADPSQLKMRGNVNTSFVNLETGLADLEFDLDNNMKVDSVRYHGQNISFIHSNHLIKISLPTNLALKTIDSVQIYYSGDPTKSRYLAYRVEKHGKNNTLAPIIWTLSQPYGAQDWWPSKNTLDDKIDSLDFIIVCPKGNEAVSNGILVSKDSLPDNLIQFHWKHRYPIVTYLVAFAITNYTLYTDTLQFSDGFRMPMPHYVYPEYLSTAQLQTPEIIPIFHLFDSLLGDYPFRNEKYGHAMFGRGGGMEHQTISFMSGFDYDLMAHELAHQWFGNKITCQSWRDIWLNEGFATYLTALCYDFLKPNEFNDVMGDIKSSVLGSNGGSVYVNDTSSVNRIFDGRLTYNKGAMLLHLLRQELTDAVFFDVLRKYINDQNFAFDFMGSAGFQKYVETHTGKDLDVFFAQWLYGEGFPVHTVEWKQNEGLISIKISQTSSHPSVSYFNTPVPLLVSNGLVDTFLLVRPQFSGEEAYFRTPFEVAEIKFDPFNQTLGKAQIINGGKLNRQIIAYPNPARNTILIKSPGMQLEEVQIYDLEGRLLDVRTSDITLDAEEMEIPLSDLKNGFYLLRCRTQKGYFVSRVQISR